MRFLRPRWKAFLGPGLIAILWVVFAGALRAAPATHAEPHKAGGLNIIKLDRGGLNRLLLPISVEGKEGLIAVDTGAATTLFDVGKFRFLLPGPGRQLPAGVPATVHVNGRSMPVGVAHHIQIGTVTLGLQPIVLGPPGILNGDSQLLGDNGASHFDGILGEDILRRFGAVVDCARQGLYLVQPGEKLNAGPGLVSAGWTRVPMSDVGNNFAVECRLGKNAYRLIVDTGAPFTTLDGGLVEREQIKTHDLPIAFGFIATRGERAQLVDSQSLAIGNYVAGNVEMIARHGLVNSMSIKSTGSLPLLGVLGSDLLARNYAIIDIGNHSLYLRPGAP